MTGRASDAEQAEVLKRLQEAERERLRKFRQETEDLVNKFVSDDTRQRHTFPPMDQTLRSVVQDVIDVAGLTGHSFGIEGVDRHVMVFKSSSLPCDEELAALRRGDVYDPEQVQLRKQQQEQEEAQEEEARRRQRKQVTPPANNYKDKYEHLIGKQAGKSAAEATVANKQFGYVPSANKRDQRSIEQTLNDIRKKKQKQEPEASHEDS